MTTVMLKSEMNSGTCRLPAECSMMVTRSNHGNGSTESAPSLRSGATQQQVHSSHHNNNTVQSDTAQAAAGKGGLQPSSPESVNAGQATAAPAAKSPPLPSQTNVPAAGTPVCDAAVEPKNAAPASAHAQSSLAPPVGEFVDGGAQDERALEPLPAPDDSEDAEAHAEYEVYLQRWRAGTTLRQRWHRLAAKGMLGDIQAEWDDWQHDLLLDTIQQQLSNAGATAGTSRQRRGRAEMEAPVNAMAAPAAAGQEPRRVRTRRAPASFQDFHVDTPASGSPDRTDPALQAADVHRHNTGTHYSAGWDAAPRAGPNNSSSLYARQQQQQQQAHLASLPRPSNLGRQLPQQSQRLPGAQLQHDLVSEEFMLKFRRTVQMVLSSGNAQGMEGAAALLADPDALKAFVATLSQVSDNPAAVMHRVAATLAGQHTQQ